MTNFDFTLVERDDVNPATATYQPKAVNFQLTPTPEGKSLFISIIQNNQSLGLIEVKYEDFLTAYAGALNKSVGIGELNDVIARILWEDSNS